MTTVPFRFIPELGSLNSPGVGPIQDYACESGIPSCEQTINNVQSTVNNLPSILDQALRDVQSTAEDVLDAALALDPQQAARNLLGNADDPIARLASDLAKAAGRPAVTAAQGAEDLVAPSDGPFDDALWTAYANEMDAIRRAEQTGATEVALTQPVVSEDGLLTFRPFTATRSGVPYGPDDYDLNAAEKAYCAKLVNKWACLRALRSRDYARAAQRRNYPATAGTDGTRANAFLHCVFIGNLSISDTDPTARGFGERHEQKPRQAGEDVEDYRKAKIMDLHNNEEGIRFGNAYAGVPLALAARREASDCRSNARLSGSLWWLLPDEKGQY